MWTKSSLKSRSAEKNMQKVSSFHIILLTFSIKLQFSKTYGNAKFYAASYSILK